MNLFKEFIKILNINLILILIGLGIYTFCVPFVFTTFTFKYYNEIYAFFTTIQHLTAEAAQNLPTAIQMNIKSPFFNTLLMFGGSFFILQGLHLISQFILSKALPVINHNLKRLAFDHAMKLDLEYFYSVNPGAIEKNVTNVADTFCSLFEIFFMLFSKLMDIITALFICKVIFKLYISTLIWVGFNCLMFYFLLKILVKYMKNKNYYQNLQSGSIAEIFDCILLFKSINCKTYLDQKFNQNQTLEDKSYKTAHMMYGVIKFIFGMLNILGLIINIYILAKFCSLNAFAGSFLFLQIWRICDKSWELLCSLIPSLNILGKFTESLDFLQKQYTSDYKSNAIECFRKLQIKNLNFYHKNAHVLKDLNLETNNDFVLIDGPSGCGKTTLMNILAGIEKVESHKVFVNGYDIKTVDNIKHLVSFFPQRDLILNDTIYNNITLNKDYDDERLLALLQLMKIEQFLPIEEIGTKMCGINGSQVSGGQAKRISLIRNFLFDTNEKIILLDEPFNNLNQEIIDNLIELLLSLKGYRTIICIDHTGNFKKIADQIIMLNNPSLL